MVKNIEEIQKNINLAIKEVISSEVFNNVSCELSNLDNNIESNLLSILKNCHGLEDRLINEMNKLSEQNIVEGKEHDLFLKGYIIGCILALQDIQCVINHKNRKILKK